MLRARIAAALALLLGGLVGCAATDGMVPGSKILTTDQFEDIPAPKAAEYRVRSAESFSYRSGPEFRSGRFVYEYEGEIETAVEFFRDLMQRPLYGWKLLGEDHMAAGSWSLEFAKGRDTCFIDVDRITRDGADLQNVVIKVRVNYKG